MKRTNMWQQLQIAHRVATPLLPCVCVEPTDRKEPLWQRGR